MQNLVSVYEVTSHEQNHTNITYFSSLVCVLGQKNKNFSDVNKSHFGLPQSRTVIHLTLSVHIVIDRVSSIKNAH